MSSQYLSYTQNKKSHYERNQHYRLVTLIMTLQRQSNQTAANLAEELGVSVHTLHCCFGMLDEMGIPIYAERGPYGGFSLVRGYKIPPLVFTPEEAVALYLGTSLVSEMWGKLYQESAQGALAKLENVLPDEQRAEIAWARRTLVASGMYCAAREQNRVNMQYQSTTGDKITERQVDPYARYTGAAGGTWLGTVTYGRARALSAWTASISWKP